jgi:hypothetical protein
VFSAAAMTAARKAAAGAAAAFSSTTTTAGATRRLIEKVTARVFCPLGATENGGKTTTGGNPVTIFLPSDLTTTTPLLTLQQCQVLARTCEWESVFVANNNNNSPASAATTTMAFFMPTGEPVQFCAHAAMGASAAAAADASSSVAAGAANTSISFQTRAMKGSSSGSRSRKSANNMNAVGAEEEEEEDAFLSSPELYHAKIERENDSTIVTMEMNRMLWTEQTVPYPPTLHRILRDYLNVASASLDVSSKPSFYNASAGAIGGGRNKTLVRLQSVRDLNDSDIVPPFNSERYKHVCESIESTGVYLYAPRLDGDQPYSFECVRFAVFVLLLLLLLFTAAQKIKSSFLARIPIFPHESYFCCSTLRIESLETS